MIGLLFLIFTCWSRNKVQIEPKKQDFDHKRSETDMRLIPSPESSESRTFDEENIETQAVLKIASAASSFRNEKSQSSIKIKS